MIERLIRGLNPWPSAYTHLDGKMLKLWDADVKAQEQTPVAKPGQIVEVGKDYFTVQTGRDLLVIRSLQLEGRERMDTEAFLRGYSLTEDKYFFVIRGFIVKEPVKGSFVCVYR